MPETKVADYYKLPFEFAPYNYIYYSMVISSIQTNLIIIICGKNSLYCKVVTIRRLS